MQFRFFNDTGRVVRIHPATLHHGCQGEKTPIKPSEDRLFLNDRRKGKRGSQAR